MRRRLLIAALLLAAWPAGADDVLKVHSLALVGTPALPDDYANFPWVNPAAPKGGDVVLGATGTFDSLNPFILRGTPAGAVSGIWEPLMASNPAELATSYGQLADTVELPADRHWVAFDLRPEARFWDGTPVTAADVVWTFNTLRTAGRPVYAQYYADVDHVEADGARRVVFRFKRFDNKELPSILGGLQVLPEHWWKGRDFASPLTELPLGSGPYRVAKADFGRTITMERVPDYWGRDMPFARGLSNFATIRTEYYRSSDVQLEAFKAGDIDWRNELSGKAWATSYDFSAVKQGLVKLDRIPTKLPEGMQGWAMNTRRPQFKDRRVREALTQLFDFDFVNKTLSYGLNDPSPSYFSGSDYAESGLPDAAETVLLQPFRAELPPEAFTTPFTLPRTDGSGNNPQGLRRAYDLFRSAGYILKDRKLIGPDGKQFSIELLDRQPVEARLDLTYAEALKRLGISVTVRTVDPAQFQHRLDSYDFDMTTVEIPSSDSPGNELFDFFSCAAGKQDGSDNIMGICDPAVDALIRKVVTAPNATALRTATHALDRVLQWGFYIVPQFHRFSVFVAYWDRFGHPAQPIRTGVEFGSWWVDPARAAKIAAARGHHG